MSFEKSQEIQDFEEKFSPVIQYLVSNCFYLNYSPNTDPTKMELISPEVDSETGLPKILATLDLKGQGEISMNLKYSEKIILTKKPSMMKNPMHYNFSVNPSLVQDPECRRQNIDEIAHFAKYILDNNLISELDSLSHPYFFVK